jgi:hypothetical protein
MLPFLLRAGCISADLGGSKKPATALIAARAKGDSNVPAAKGCPHRHSWTSTGGKGSGTDSKSSRRRRDGVSILVEWDAAGHRVAFFEVIGQMRRPAISGRKSTVSSTGAKNQRCLTVGA